MVMAPLTLDSAVLPCFHDCPASLHRHFPPVSSLTSPPSVSPQSTAALTLGSLHNPQTPASSHCAFLGTHVPVWGIYGCGKDCLILIPFGLPQVSCFTLSLKYFSSGSDNCPVVGIRPLLQFPQASEGRSSPTNTPVSAPSSFGSEFCMVLYTLCHWSSTPVCSQLVFFMCFCV